MLRHRRTFGNAIKVSRFQSEIWLTAGIFGECRCDIVYSKRTSIQSGPVGNVFMMG